jgi:acetylornithine/N-succinyldiaminopimelate aminotransferase
MGCFSISARERDPKRGGEEHSMIAPILPTYARVDLAFERGEGAYLFTADGQRYLDFCAGVAVDSMGHAHPDLVRALTAQAGKLWHTSNLYRVPGQERLAQKLIAASFADTVFFCNSGAEAIEGSIKTARKFHASEGHPERYRLITFEGAFHGRTLATLAAGGQAKYLEGFGPRVDGFDQVPFGDLKAVRAAIGPETAGFLVEPIQGEGGVRMPPPGFLAGLRKLADDHGILLVLDEVQTGIGRTGRLFAHEWTGITPDIMALAKGIGGGFPMGAFLATARAAKGMTIGSHASTFGGNPLAMAVGEAVLDLVLAPAFLENVRRVGGSLAQRAAGLVASYDDILEGLRGEGLMLGIKARLPNTEIVEAARAEGLLVFAAGDNVVRMMPPLVIGEAEVAEGIDKLESACRALRKRAKETA